MDAGAEDRADASGVSRHGRGSSEDVANDCRSDPKIVVDTHVHELEDALEDRHNEVVDVAAIAAVTLR